MTYASCDLDFGIATGDVGSFAPVGSFATVGSFAIFGSFVTFELFDTFGELGGEVGTDGKVGLSFDTFGLLDFFFL